MTFTEATDILENCQHGGPCDITFKGKELHVCRECELAYHAAWKQARKEQLDAQPRCEFCDHRQTLTACYEIPMCGRCFAKARRKLLGSGLIFYTFTAADVRAVMSPKA